MNKLVDILISRKFWASLVALAFVFVAAYKPDFPVTEEQIIGLAMIIISYVAGTALDPGAPVTSLGKKLLALIQSKKFWTSVVGIVILFISDKFPFGSELLVELITYLVSALVVGFGVADRIKYTNGTA